MEPVTVTPLRYSDWVFTMPKRIRKRMGLDVPKITAQTVAEELRQPRRNTKAQMRALCLPHTRELRGLVRYVELVVKGVDPLQLNRYRIHPTTPPQPAQTPQGF